MNKILLFVFCGFLFVANAFAGSIWEQVLVSYSPQSTNEHILKVETDTSRDMAEFKSNVPNEDVNIATTATHSNSSAGHWFKLPYWNAGGGISVGHLPDRTEVSIGVGPTPDNMFFQAMTGFKVKHVMDEFAYQQFARKEGFGFGTEPQAFFHLKEPNHRYNSIAPVFRIDSVTDDIMEDGYGGSFIYNVQDAVSGPYPVAEISGVRSGGNYSGAVILKAYKDYSVSNSAELRTESFALFKPIEFVDPLTRKSLWFFARTNSSGKQEFCVKFENEQIYVLATQQ